MRKAYESLLRRIHVALSFHALWKLLSVLADARLPQPLLDAAIRAYCSALGVDMSEAVVPEGGFKSFNEFFTRRLKNGARTVTQDQASVACPCDGTVSACGVVEEGRLVQAKGREYTLAALIGSEEIALRFAGGPYLTVYLSPRDYHRVHSPCDCRVVMHSYIPGRTFSVGQFPVRTFSRIYVRNERMVFLMDSDRHGEVLLCMVGAAGVSRMTLSNGELARTWHRRGARTQRHVPGPEIRKGEELGVFNLGSTVVMCLDGKRRWEFLVHGEGSRVKMGQAVFRDITCE